MTDTPAEVAEAFDRVRGAWEYGQAEHMLGTEADIIRAHIADLERRLGELVEVRDQRDAAYKMIQAGDEFGVVQERRITELERQLAEAREDRDQVLRDLATTTDCLVRRAEAAESQLAAQRERDGRWFPLLGTPFAIRRSVLNEEQAKRNHYQTLDQLASRGRTVAEHRIKLEPAFDEWLNCQPHGFTATLYASPSLSSAGPLNRLGVLTEALAFVVDHADKDEDPEQWTLTRELRRHIALASGPSGVGDNG